MNERIVVDIRTLRQVAAVLLDHLEELKGSRVGVKHDMFWSVPAPEVFDVYSQPATLTIGQLSESWDLLRGALEDGRPLAYHLVWLGDLLRAIGLEVVK